MYIHTYGNPGDPVVLLLHPMLVSGKQMYDLIGTKLKGNYFIIAPDQSSHGNDGTAYISPEKDGDVLYRYLKDNNYTDITMMSTLSLGGVLAMQLLKRDDLKFHSIHIDGVPLAPTNLFTKIYVPLLYMYFWKKANKDMDVMVEKLSDMYGESMGRNMAVQFTRMSRESVRKITEACVRGCAITLDEEIQKRITFEWGENEINARYGKDLAEMMYPMSKVVIRNGYDHCVYMTKNIDDYVDELCRELAEREQVE